MGNQASAHQPESKGDEVFCVHLMEEKNCIFRVSYSGIRSTINPTVTYEQQKEEETTGEKDPSQKQVKDATTHTVVPPSALTQILWSAPIQSEGYQKMAMCATENEDFLLVGHRDGKISAFSMEKGKEEWFIELSSFIQDMRKGEKDEEGSFQKVHNQLSPELGVTELGQQQQDQQQQQPETKTEEDKEENQENQEQQEEKKEEEIEERKEEEQEKEEVAEEEKNEKEEKEEEEEEGRKEGDLGVTSVFSDPPSRYAFVGTSNGFVIVCSLHQKTTPSFLFCGSFFSSLSTSSLSSSCSLLSSDSKLKERYPSVQNVEDEAPLYSQASAIEREERERDNLLELYSHPLSSPLPPSLSSPSAKASGSFYSVRTSCFTSSTITSLHVLEKENLLIVGFFCGLISVFKLKSKKKEEKEEQKQEGDKEEEKKEEKKEEKEEGKEGEEGEEGWEVEERWKLVGHVGSVDCLVVCWFLNILVSASSDGTIRLWSLVDGNLIAVYSHRASVMKYDPLRDLIFCANVDGSISIMKMFSTFSLPSKKRGGEKGKGRVGLNAIQLRVVKTLETNTHGVATALHFNSKSDTIVASLQSPGGNIFILWAGATGVRHSDAARTQLSYGKNRPVFSDGEVDSLFKTLNLFLEEKKEEKEKEKEKEEKKEDKEDKEGDKDEEKQKEEEEKGKGEGEKEDGVLRRESIWELNQCQQRKKEIEESLALLDGGGDEDTSIVERRKNLKSSLENITQGAQKKLDHLTRTHSEVLHEFSHQHWQVVDPVKGKAAVLSQNEQMKEELRRRHEREREELERKCEQRVHSFDVSLLVLQQQVAFQYQSLDAGHQKQKASIDYSTAKQFHSLLSSSHPLVAKRYQIGCKISPNASSVFNGLDALSMQPVAIKQMPSIINLTVNLSHPNLVPILDVCKTEGTNFVVMKKMSCNLLQFLESGQQLSQKEINFFIKQLLEVVAYVHQQRMVFRDIRPSNVLLDENKKPYLVHMGVMRQVTGHEPTESETVFAPPEILSGSVHMTSDVFSVAAVFAFLLQTPEERKEKPLFPAPDRASALATMGEVLAPPTEADVEMMTSYFKMQGHERQLLYNLLDYRSMTQPQSCLTLPDKVMGASEQALDLLGHMLVFNPLRRFTATAALDHPFFREEAN